MIALERAGIKVDNYYASEIKKHAIKVSKSNYPGIIHIGDVTKVSYKDGVLYTEFGEHTVGRIDLLIGGSPCQDFSSAKCYGSRSADCFGGNGLEGNKSKLFYEYLRIKNEVNPTHFLLENVKMRKDSQEKLDKYLGVAGVHINSSLVSYQRRNRCYWFDIPNFTQPTDKNVLFRNFKSVDAEYCKTFKVNQTPSRIRMWNNGLGKNSMGSCANVTNADKIFCLTTKQDRSPQQWSCGI